MKNRILLLPTLLAMLMTQSIWAGPAERAMAKRIHDRLTGVNATNAVIDAMEATIDCTLPATPGYPCDGTGKNAALYAIDTTRRIVSLLVCNPFGHKTKLPFDPADVVNRIVLMACLLKVG